MGGWIYRDRQCTGRVAEGGREGENGKTKRKAADADVRTGRGVIDPWRFDCVGTATWVGGGGAANEASGKLPAARSSHQPSQGRQRCLLFAAFRFGLAPSTPPAPHECRLVRFGVFLPALRLAVFFYVIRRILFRDWYGKLV